MLPLEASVHHCITAQNERPRTRKEEKLLVEQPEKAANSIWLHSKNTSQEETTFIAKNADSGPAKIELNYGRRERLPPSGSKNGSGN